MENEINQEQSEIYTCQSCHNRITKKEHSERIDNHLNACPKCGNNAFSFCKESDLARRITKEEWFVEAEKRYGKEKKKWRFKCPQCGNVQSIESIKERIPGLTEEEIWSNVYYNCEGRLKEGIGLNWTLGGLFQIHKIEVCYKEDFIPVFEFAD